MTQRAEQAHQDRTAEGTCPVGSSRPVLMTDRLRMPLSKRLVMQTLAGASGPELHLFHGQHQIVFDEPEMFGFADGLARHDHFVAAEAVSWLEKGRWDQVAPLLADLVETGLLVIDDGSRNGHDIPVDRLKPSPLPAARYETPRFWTDPDHQIFDDLLGIRIEPGHLEQVIPVFRIAHPALDADGRQIGEANVFPRALRLDRPGEWMTCLYSGTRYLVDRPMNATALKAMREHWPQMMASLLVIRSAFLDHFPEARTSMTIGHLERLCVLVLAVPTWQLLKPAGQIANGGLHPALSSLFRVTDGLRMACHQMLFVPVGEPMLPPDMPVSVAMVHDYAERNYSFHSETGVCAGPKRMVEEFLKVIIEGHVPDSVSRSRMAPEISTALGDLDDAFDYGLRGLRVFAAIFTIWPAMAACYQELAAIAETRPMSPSLRDALTNVSRQVDAASLLGQADWRAQRLAVFSDIHAASGIALGLPASNLAGDLSPSHALREPLVAELSAFLSKRLDDHAAASTMAESLLRFFRHAQLALATSGIDQDSINAMTGRPAPALAFGLRELDAYNRLQDANRPRLPFLIDVLGELFDLSVTVTGHTITFRPFGAHTDLAGMASVRPASRDA